MARFSDVDFIKETGATRRSDEYRTGTLTGWETVIFELQEIHPPGEIIITKALPQNNPVGGEPDLRDRKSSA